MQFSPLPQTGRNHHRDRRWQSWRPHLEPLEDRTLLDATGSGAPNLLQNPGFENGLQGWFAWGASTVAATTAQAHSGSQSALVSNRTAPSQGIAQNIRTILQPGRHYAVSARVLLENADAQPFKLTVHQVDDAGTRFLSMERIFGSSSEWRELFGGFTLQVTGTLTSLNLYVEGPPAGVNFYVDDLCIAEPDWRQEADARIAQVRQRDVQFQIVDGTGTPLPGVSVQVSQVRNQFAFGTTLNSGRISNPNYAAFVRENFEWGVPEFEAKWRTNESTPGNLNYTLLDNLVAFARANDLRLRGHNVFWEVENFVPDWVRQLSGNELLAAMEGRLASVVPRYRDVFEHWDVNNEMLHGSFYRDRLSDLVWTWMYLKTNALDPDARLFVNDYQVLEYNQEALPSHRIDDYIAQIQQLLASGAPVHGIGLQGHFSRISPYTVQRQLDRLAELGLPIWITEFDVAHPDANVRADQLEALYRVAFSHPAVEGILMWGFWAGAHWRGPDAALVDLDWTVNAAGRRYQDLRAEWTTNVTGTSGEDGGFSFRGYYGTYDITLTPAGGNPVVTRITLEPGDGPQVFTLTAAGPDGPALSTLPDQAIAGDGAAAVMALVIDDVDTPPDPLTLADSLSVPEPAPEDAILSFESEPAWWAMVTSPADQLDAVTTLITIDDPDGGAAAGFFGLTVGGGLGELSQ